MQRARQCLQQISLNLIAHGVGIDHQATVVSTGDAQHANAAIAAIDFDFDSDRYISLVMLVVHVRNSAAARLFTRAGAGGRWPR